MLKKAHAPVLKAGSSIKSGGFGPGVPPLPIPNREVKPVRADGTAPQCGRVGRRRFNESPSSRNAGGILYFVQSESRNYGITGFRHIGFST